MLSNLDKGKEGEDLAVKFLEEKGYTIVERNYRHQRSEIDIIAAENEVLVFVEVKYRIGTSYGNPEEAVTNKKLEMIAIGAEQYCYDNPNYIKIRFDIVSITVDKKKNEIDFYHIEDVYF